MHINTITTAAVTTIPKRLYSWILISSCICLNVTYILFNDNVNLNDNKLSAECVYKLLSRLAGENQRSLANKGKSKLDKLIQNQTG